MDNLIHQLEQLTNDMLARLEHIDYTEMIDFVDKRQVIVDRIGQLVVEESLTSTQKERISVLMDYDGLLLSKMRGFKREASDWLQQRSIAKVRRVAYENAYSPDAILMDRRE